MTTPASPSSISAQQIDLEANKRPSTNFGGVTPDPAGTPGTMWPYAVFGNDPAGNQWANLLEKNASYETSFDRLRGKQNAFTLYDSSTFFVKGGCGAGECDTLTLGLDIAKLYDTWSVSGGKVVYGNIIPPDMWFSVDVAAVSTSGGGSGGKPAWDCCSPGNYNGSYEVFRFYFKINPNRTKITDLKYVRNADVGSGVENMSPGEYSTTSIGVYYELRPNFTRSGGDIKGNKLFVYYVPTATSKTVYAAAQYSGYSDSKVNTRVYILRVMFWPPTARNIGNLLGGAKQAGGVTPIDTNQEHVEYINNMNSYLGIYPPIASTVGNLNSSDFRIGINCSSPWIVTNGKKDEKSHGGGCFAPESLVTMFDGTLKPIRDIKIGEYVKDRKGRKNKVAAIEITKIGNYKLHSINGSKYFVTEQHIMATKDGWGAIDPSRIGSNSTVESDTVDFMRKNLYNVETGAKLCVENGYTEIKTIESKEVEPNFEVYNLILENDLSYIVEGFVVMTDVEQSAPTVELRQGFDKALFFLVKRAYSKEKKFGQSFIRGFLEHISRHRTTYVHKKKQGKIAPIGALYTGIAAVVFQLAWLLSSINKKDECKACKIREIENAS